MDIAKHCGVPCDHVTSMSSPNSSASSAARFCWFLHSNGGSIYIRGWNQTVFRRTYSFSYVVVVTTGRKRGYAEAHYYA